MSIGAQSMVEPLCRVLVRRPDEAFADADPTRWHYAGRPDLERARAEHDALVAILRQQGVEVVYHQRALPEHADAIYVFDPAIVTERGAVILAMGKSLRRGEEEALARTFADLDVPVLGGLDGDARAEGGDLLWLDRRTLLIGLGFRTNSAGVEQLRTVLAPLGVEILTTETPYHQGPESCLHLMSSISLLDHDLAVAYPPLLTVPCWRLLMARGIELIEVPDEEYPTMGANVLALAPRRGLMLEGNPRTRRRLEAAGCEILTYRGEEISLKAEGGPTCLTRPLLRRA